jgi:hypothetical protein
MLKINNQALDNLKRQYPGIREMIQRFERVKTPICPYCQSSATAAVSIGAVEYSVQIAAATTKYKSIEKGPAPGKFYCHDCGKYFD